MQSPALLPHNRRLFLQSISSIGLGLSLPTQSPFAQTPVKRERIDTHHHLWSTQYLEALKKNKLASALAEGWSVQKTLEDMEQAGVKTSILSVTTPAVAFAPTELARALARESNEWVARLQSEYPNRFGSFAMIPMQDTESALKEIAYSLDILKADGVCLMTSYGDKWLGNALYAPVMDELNRRNAIVYTHPTRADCCRNLQPEIPPTVVEYGTDTTRTIVDIIFSGTAARCPKIDFIFSHGGGVLPFLTDRLEWVPKIDKKMQARVPHGVMHEIQRFYYDTAWISNPMSMSALLKMVPIEKILFASDYPYRTGESIYQGLNESGLNAAQLRAIGWENAQRLMPHWKSQ